MKARGSAEEEELKQAKTQSPDEMDGNDAEISLSTDPVAHAEELKA